MDNRAIGVFDSGLGGLTAVKRLHEIMPKESIIYFGDTGRVPYGTRGRDTIIKYTRQDIRFLLQYDIKAIVVACNTASSAALETVQNEFDLPIFGTVEPSCRKALKVTENGRIGVIGTAATVRSNVFTRSLKSADKSLEIIEQACPLFVPLVENGRVNRGDVVIETVAREYLKPLKEAGVDALILGCTHYPLLYDVIACYMGAGVTLIDSGAEAANAVKNAVELSGNESGGTQYFVSDDPSGFSRLASLFLQEDVEGEARLVDITRYESGSKKNPF